MPILKCIGGELDGQNRYVDDDWKRLGNHVRFPKAPRIALMEFDAADNAKIDLYVYKVCCFCFSKDDNYWYLIPEGWTEKQAILHQMEK